MKIFGCLLILISGVCAFAQSSTFGSGITIGSPYASSAPGNNSQVPDICTEQGLAEGLRQLGQKRSAGQPEDGLTAAFSAALAPPSTGKPQRSTEDQNLDARIELSHALNAVSPSIMSDRFKMQMLEMPKILEQLLNGKLAYSPNLVIPWPANEPNAKSQQLTEAEIQGFASQIPTAQLATLKKAVVQNRGMGSYGMGVADIDKKSAPLAKDEKFSEVDTAEIIEEAKRSLIEAIANDADNARISPTQASMIDRIKRIKIRSVCPGSTFDPVSMTGDLCLSKKLTRDAAVGGLISQMASTVDDCNMETPFLKVDPVAVDNFLKTAKFKYPGDRYNLTQCLKGRTAVTEDCLSEGSPDLLKQVEEAGLISTGLQPIDPHGLAFKSVRSCYASQAQMRILTDADFKKYADQIVRIRKSQYGQVYDEKADRKRLTQDFLARPSCYDTNELSQERRTMNAWLITRAAAAHLKSYEHATQEQVIDTLRTQIINGSLLSPSYDQSKKAQTAGDIIRTAAMEQMTIKDVHELPGAGVIEKVLLSQPDIRKALGCGAKAVKPVCESNNSIRPTRSSKGIK